MPTLPGDHFLHCLLATAGSAVDFPGRGGAGLSPESRRPLDGKSGVSVNNPPAKGADRQGPYAAQFSGPRGRLRAPEASWRGDTETLEGPEGATVEEGKMCRWGKLSWGIDI